jgi:2-keto-3-deoxy-L-fuconate dehydrogenase
MSMQNLENKAVLITAAAQGIGRASAIRFSEAGAKVYATDVNEAALRVLATDYPSIQTAILDVRSSTAINSLVMSIGIVDVLFNCAGYVHQGTILECAEENWNFSFDLNVASAYRTCRAVLPGMLERKGGSIINMASVVSSIKGAPNRFAYGATKAAIVGLTKAIAADFVTKGIRCNCLCPGTIETPSLEDRISQQGNYDEVRAAFVSRQPMGRLGKPEEIAAAAVFLGSDDSAFMTGQAIVIDGGWSI